MKHSKVAIIGAGAVGATTAYALMLNNDIAEIILVDVDQKRCHGEVLDLSDALSFCRASKIRSGSMADARNADIIIIAAGARQQPGQKRSELISTNKKILAQICAQLTPINADTIVIVVTNPVDVLTMYAQELLGLPKTQIVGSGTYLDSQRLCHQLSRKFNIAEESITALMLGEHGDSQFAAWSCASIAGTPLAALNTIKQEDLDAIEKDICNKAYEIISCKDATYYGIASCVAAMCQAIIFDKKLVLPLSCYQDDLEVCLSMPVVLGERGIEQQLPLPLSDTERNKLLACAHAIKTTT